MADELDKFVLAYQVQLADSIQRLEKLNEKVKKVNVEAKKSGEELKAFAQGASNELGRLVPGIDRVSNAVSVMGGKFALASAAVGTLAVGVAAVMRLNTKYQEQRRAGQEIGISPIRAEEYQRQLFKGSGGRVSREQALQEVHGFSTRIREAYSDPTRLGDTARAMSAIGVNVGARGQGSTPTNAALTQLAQQFQRMRPDQVIAAAKSIGMSQDFAMTLRKIGPAIGEIREQSEEDIKRSLGAQKSLDAYNDSLTRINAEFARASDILAERLVPWLTKFVDLMAKASEGMLPRDAAKKSVVEEAGSSAARTFLDMFDMRKQASGDGAWKGGLLSHIEDLFGRGEKEMQARKGASDAKTEEAANTNKQNADKNVKAASALADAADKQQREGRITSDELLLAANMFSGAVATFANAIDERQAWAAWAGEIGRAAGLKGASGGDPSQRTGLPSGRGSSLESRFAPTQLGPVPFEDIINAASKQYGLNPDVLKGLIKTESGFDPNAVGPKTKWGQAQGLGQLLPSIQQAYGITDPFDPRQNIHGAARLLSENMARAGGDVNTALMMYHGGLNRANWGELTRAYPNKVLGTQGAGLPGMAGPAKTASGILGTGPLYAQDPFTAQPQLRGPAVRPAQQTGGESVSNIQRAQVYANIAQRLGVPVTQIRHGAVNRDDVNWASSQLMVGVHNQIEDLKKNLQNPGLTASDRAGIIQQLREQQSGLSMLKAYSPEIIARQREGARSITIGENAISIRIVDSQNPQQTAAAVHDRLSTELSDVATQMNDGVQY